MGSKPREPNASDASTTSKISMARSPQLLMSEQSFHFEVKIRKIFVDAPRLGTADP